MLPAGTQSLAGRATLVGGLCQFAQRLLQGFEHGDEVRDSSEGENLMDVLVRGAHESKLAAVLLQVLGGCQEYSQARTRDVLGGGRNRK